MTPSPAPEVTWRTLVRMPGYRFGADGRIQRRNLGSGAWTEAHASADGRGAMRMTYQAGGRKRKYFLHRLILEAFAGPCPAGMRACHLDGDPGHNAIGNLRWVPGRPCDGVGGGGPGLGEADAAEVARRIEEVRAEKQRRPRPMEIRRVHDPRRTT